MQTCSGVGLVEPTPLWPTGIDDFLQMNEYILGRDVETELRDPHRRSTGLKKQDLGGLRDGCNQVRLSELYVRIEATGYVRLTRLTMEISSECMK